RFIPLLDATQIPHRGADQEEGRTSRGIGSPRRTRRSPEPDRGPRPPDLAAPDRSCGALETPGSRCSEYKLRSVSFWRYSAAWLLHVSSRFTLSSLLPIPVASYQWTSASQTTPSARRTVAIPFRLRHRARPYSRRSRARSRIECVTAMVSTCRMGPMSSKYILPCGDVSSTFLQR